MASLLSRQKTPDARAPSPRPSIASSTGTVPSSRTKKPQLDFEDALSNSETLYLRPVSVVDSDEGRGGVDEDAPHPVEKLSFEEELRGSGGRVRAFVALPVLLETPVGKFNQPGTPTVVPPTPNSDKEMEEAKGRTERYNSVASSSGSASSTSNSLPKRSDSLLAMTARGSGAQVEIPLTPVRSQKPAVGLDAEVETTSPMNGTTSSHFKRRSIFRSPGTASSPDLATLVKKAREARAALPSPSDPQETIPATLRGGHTPSGPVSPSPTPVRRRAPPPPIDVPSASRTSASASRDRAASHGGALRTGSAVQRAVSSANTDEEWQRFTNQNDVHAVGSGIAGGRQRQLASEQEDGFKSMSKKARGVFGRMFGQKDKIIPSSSRNPIGYNASTDSFYPPAPPLTSSHSTRIPTKGQFSEHLPKETTAYTLATTSAGQAATSSATAPPSQVRPRAGSDLEKPLPPIARPAGTQSRNANRLSLHLRQPATSDDVAGMSTGRSDEWQEHVNDVFESIGSDEPSRGLGLPPSAMASSATDQRRLLGHSSSSPPTAIADGPLSHPLVDLAKGYAISQRTHSLPSKMPTLGAQIAPNSSAQAERVRASSGAPRFSALPDFAAKRDPLALTPQTVRLVSSNRPRSYIGQSSPIKRIDMTESEHGASDWTNGTSTSTPPRQADERLETVAAPEGSPVETEEEKGRRLACEFLEGDETNVTREKIAVFLGGTRPANKAALRYYMQYFDWAGQRLDNAFRELCSRLHLKAETQEISRILEGFSERYYECNTGTIYGSSAIVYVVTGSFLLLNTDLHIAEISSHMSRSQFVRLTMETITQSIQSDRASTPDLVRDDGSSSRGASGSTSSVVSGHGTSSPSTLRNVRSFGANGGATGFLNGGASLATLSTTETASGPPVAPVPTRSVSASSGSTSAPTRSWEIEMETVLKDIYAAVKTNQILLPQSVPVGTHRHSMVSMGTASPHSTMGRTRSMHSPSGASSDRVNVLKRGSIRGMQSLLGSSPYGATHDGRVSPTPSVATSIGEGFYQSQLGATLGFASNLSHSVIREHDDEVQSLASATSTGTVDEMTDDELALLGAPWAKEGMLSRKMYWEAPNKRAKQKDWNKYFAVIQTGDIHLFVFGGGGGAATSAAVGGGNWMANATPIQEINLSHSLASALPKPGYNAARPYCFSVSLPSGEMSFYQAGTEELVQEWVSTCNYWAARRSRPPLQGGISNMEYGWSRVGEIDDRDDTMSVMSSRSARNRLGGSSTVGRRGSSNAERMHINDWKPAQPTLMPSKIDEEAQLEALQKYAQSLMDGLEAHKALEEPMRRLYLPRSTNGVKALENWKAKSLFIHSEIVKYETYVSALRSAISLRVKHQGERKLDKALKRAGEDDDSDLDDKIIYHGGDVFGPGRLVEDEDDEPVTPSQRQFTKI